MSAASKIMKCLYLPIGIVSTYILEYRINKSKKTLKLIKSIPLYSIDSFRKAPSISPKNYMIYTSLNNLYYGYLNELPLYLIKKVFISLNDSSNKNILYPSQKLNFIYSREYHIEKVRTYYYYFQKLIGTLFNKTIYIKINYPVLESQFTTSPLVDYRKFFLCKDKVLLCGNKFEWNFGSCLILKPSLILQGNKYDLICYYKNMLNKLRNKRMFITFPLVCYIMIMGFKYIRKWINKVRSHNELANGDVNNLMNPCMICLNKGCEVIFKKCNHFVTCEECYFKYKTCPICNEKIYDVIIIK